MRRTKFLDLYIEPARLLLYALHPVISAEAQLDRSTRCFPLTIGETMIFNLQTVSYHPLLLLYISYYKIHSAVTITLEEVFTFVGQLLGQSLLVISCSIGRCDTLDSMPEFVSSVHKRIQKGMINMCAQHWNSQSGIS